MHMYNFLCSDSLLYFFLFLSTLHSVYTRDCSCSLLEMELLGSEDIELSPMSLCVDIFT